MSSQITDYDHALELSGTLKMGRSWVLLQLSPSTFAQLVAQVPAEVAATIKVNTNNPHVSVIKDEKPSLNQADWDGKRFDGEQVSLRVNTRTLHQTNGRHAWFDCHSPRLADVRDHFGLPVLRKDGVCLVNFHVSMGKLLTPREPQPRPQYRLSIRSHIDAATLMQHI